MSNQQWSLPSIHLFYGFGGKMIEVWMWSPFQHIVKSIEQRFSSHLTLFMSSVLSQILF